MSSRKADRKSLAMTATCPDVVGITRVPGVIISQARSAPKLPALLIPVLVLSITSTTLAQCEVHEAAKLTASDAALSDGYGWSVAVSGDIVVVGVIADDCPAGPLCGSAYVYRFNGNKWIEELKLTASDVAAGDNFGRSVSVSGEVAVVGAPEADCAAGRDCGSAYVYRFNGNTWVQQAKLAASDAAAYNFFGGSVSVSGDVFVVGAPLADCMGAVDCGSAYVYRLSGSTWIQQTKLTAMDAAPHDRFGISVSVSGDLLIVGADTDNCAAGSACGSAYVYRFNGSIWDQEAKLTASDAAGFDRFGFSVSVSGEVALVGAYSGNCPAGFDCGSAYVYRFDGKTWVQEGKLTASDAASDDWFGFSVSVNGDTSVVGAPFHSYGPCDDCGSAYLYRFNGSAWLQQTKLIASDAGPGDWSGFSLSVSGDTIIVGTVRNDCKAGVDCGSAYVYELASLPLSSDCNANGVGDECDIADGTSVDCNGNRVPDDCEFTDCNANCIPDGQDISEGTSRDCNGNSIPDECDIASCTGDLGCADCNVNSIPDGCEADCNSNSIPDECDIYMGVSRDTDVNGIPDECEAGACCDGSTDLCADDVPMALCAGDRRIWSVNTLCAKLEPACIAPTGACCDHDPFGACTDGVTSADCNCGQCEWTKLASCDDVACPHDSIPTVSSWGLAILSLLLLTGAKIRFGRIHRNYVGTERESP